MSLSIICRRISGAALTIAGAVALCHPFDADAKPARRGLSEVTQPDGTTLLIQKFGDEYNHYTLTEDGMPVIQTERGWEYLTLGADGMPVPSGILASASVSATRSASLDAENTIAALKARQPRRKPVYARAEGDATRGPGLMDNFPSKGTQLGLVVLVEYTDVKFKTPDVATYFSDLLNKPGFDKYENIGSARDWFIDNSRGQFTPQFDVYGPLTLKYSMAYYGMNDAYGYDMRAELMALEACQQLDATVDFSKYDRDGDGYIDNIYVYYAGYGEADYKGANAENTVWPHSWSLEESKESGGAVGKDYFFDDVKLNKYACSNELDGYLNRPDGIGTFVHEFSHVMGLPDLYCTVEIQNSKSEPFTPGEFSVLDYGPYNGEGCVPPRYSAYERYALDWMKPYELNSTRDVRLNTIDENVAYIIPTEKSREYFLIENRQQEGWDTYIPYHGMLVWHVDYLSRVFTQNSVNNTASHQYVDLVEADNRQTLMTQTGDPFPGKSRVTSFGFRTTPALKSWGDKPLVINSIDNIAENDADNFITFRAVKTDDSGSGGVEELTSEDCKPAAGNGDTTEIAPVRAAETDGTVWTIDGRPVRGDILAPGLYIRDGRKFIVR